MKRLKRNIFMAIMFIGITVTGQTTDKSINNQPNIEVTGVAEKEIVPDEIYITIRIKERYEGKDKITIDSQEKDLKDALTKIGISTEDFYLSNVSSNYIKYNWTKKDVLSENEYILKVGDAVTVGKVFNELSELKIMNAFVSKVSHSKIKEFEKEVRILAMKTAKEKADYLLNAIGEETGGTLKVRETNTSNIQEIETRGSRSSGVFYFIDGIKVRGATEKDIQFKKIKLQSIIYIKFAIK